MQKFKFPMEFLRVTQGEFSTYSHAGSMAIDFGGKDTGSDKLYCPCDMLVKRCREKANGELYLESTEPVLFADGSSDYARLLCIHDSTFKVKVGDIIPPGQFFYEEGGMGGGNPHKFGTHVHMEAGKGNWKSTTQAKNSSGTYVIENQAHLYDLFILGKDVQILDGGGYDWVVDGESKSTLSENTVYGFDISNHQANANVDGILAHDKTRFIIMRACTGSRRVDESLDKFLEKYKEMDKDIPIGFYADNYFVDRNDAIAEADYLIKTIEDRGFTPQNLALPIFCDWEGFSYEYNLKHGNKVTPAMLQNMVEGFCNRVIEKGYKVGIYTNYNYYVNMFTEDFFKSHPEYYIWYARPGYTKPDKDCYIWQYRSEAATEFGVTDTLDKDILLGDFIDNNWEICDKQYIVIKSNCEYFNSVDVYDTVGKLLIDTIITITSTKVVDDLTWGKFIIDGVEKYVVLLEDRIVPYLPPIDEPNIPKPVEPEVPEEPEIPVTPPEDKSDTNNSTPDTPDKDNNDCTNKKPEDNQEQDELKKESWFVIFLRWLLELLTKD